MTGRQLVALAATGILLGALGVGFTSVHTATTSTETTPPDWTVAPCTLWSDAPGDTAPTVPAYTRLDRCVDSDGTMIYTTPNHP